ncbi:MAG: class I SAM-dependent DNA methyltransferase [Succinivibrio sp.]|nr:class I SAM-dependent DNA methyltransferase [Succinivibrio sp.]
MITGALKNKVDGLWDIFYSGGISNPLKVIEQITYLMFIHDLGDWDEAKAKKAVILNVPYRSIFDGHEDYRWSRLINMNPDQMKNTVENEIFPMLKTLAGNKKTAFSRYMQNAKFEIDSAQKLVSVVTFMDDLYKTMEKELKDQDTMGDIYEYMLSKLGTSDKLGQFRTPRHIIRMMVELIKPSFSDIICDPACGTAGFLIEAGKYIKEHYPNELLKTDIAQKFNSSMFTGYDTDRTMLEIAAMNMMQHHIEDPNIAYKNGLTVPESNQIDEKEKYTVVLANPPFKGSLDKDTIHPELKAITNTTKTELLFIAQFLKLLKIGGKAAVIVPNGVLFGSSKAHVTIRKELIEHNSLKAVISLPSGVFKPYAGVSTAILIFVKTGNGGTDKIWFYDLHSDGFSLDDKRQPIEDNDIPDVISRYNNLSEEEKRGRTEQSFFVQKEEVVANGYDLSVNKYKEVIYEQEELPSSEEIMKELCELESEYHKELDILKKMLENSSVKE